MAKRVTAPTRAPRLKASRAERSPAELERSAAAPTPRHRRVRRVRRVRHPRRTRRQVRDPRHRQHDAPAKGRPYQVCDSAAPPCPSSQVIPPRSNAPPRTEPHCTQPPHRSTEHADRYNLTRSPHRPLRPPPEGEPRGAEPCGARAQRGGTDAPTSSCASCPSPTQPTTPRRPGRDRRPRRDPRHRQHDAPAEGRPYQVCDSTAHPRPPPEGEPRGAEPCGARAQRGGTGGALRRTTSHACHQHHTHRSRQRAQSPNTSTIRALSSNPPHHRTSTRLS